MVYTFLRAALVSTLWMLLNDITANLAVLKTVQIYSALHWSYNPQPWPAKPQASNMEVFPWMPVTAKKCPHVAVISGKLSYSQGEHPKKTVTPGSNSFHPTVWLLEQKTFKLAEHTNQQTDDTFKLVLTTCYALFINHNLQLPIMRRKQCKMSTAVRTTSLCLSDSILHSQTNFCAESLDFFVTNLH